MSCALYGCDHAELDELVDAAVDDHIGIALTRGRFPKGYAHVDPNEDAVVAVSGPAAVLLAVADGHGGAEASHAAIGAIAARADAQLRGSESSEGIVTALFRAARDEVARALAVAPRERQASRTALSVALVDDDGLHTATAGDTSVAVVGARRCRVCSTASPFLGPRTSVPPVRHRRLRAADAVVVVSDGVADFLGSRWWRAVAPLVVGAASAQEAAAVITGAAMDGGAGDNAAAAVWLP